MGISNSKMLLVSVKLSVEEKNFCHLNAKKFDCDGNKLNRKQLGRAIPDSSSNISAKLDEGTFRPIKTPVLLIVDGHLLSQCFYAISFRL